VKDADFTTFGAGFAWTTTCFTTGTRLITTTRLMTTFVRVFGVRVLCAARTFAAFAVTEADCGEAEAVADWPFAVAVFVYVGTFAPVITCQQW